jgi:hypothetical protein
MAVDVGVCHCGALGAVFCCGSAGFCVIVINRHLRDGQRCRQGGARVLVIVGDRSWLMHRLAGLENRCRGWGMSAAFR